MSAREITTERERERQTQTRTIKTETLPLIILHLSSPFYARLFFILGTENYFGKNPYIVKQAKQNK